MRQPLYPDPYQALDKAYRAAYLIAGFIRHTLTIQEEEELDEWLHDNDANQEVFATVTADDKYNNYLSWYDQKDIEDKLRETKSRILQEQRTKRINNILKYAAISTGIIVIALLSYFELNKSVTDPAIAAAKDMLPGVATATLQTPDGKRILLAPGKDTTIDANTTVVKDELQQQASTISGWNQLTVPRKGNYRIMLPDGTRVWLNASSSLRYPGSFQGTTREVFVDGEAFFEVARDVDKPFIVHAGTYHIKALGTAFNINAYPEDKQFVATLVEGKINVSSATRNMNIDPSASLQIENDQWDLRRNTDIRPLIAWKHNEFMLRNTNIKTIMRLIERWYDTKVIYRDNIDVHFNGTISRNVPLSEVLQLLEETGDVHFTIHKNEITVMK